MTQKQVSDVLKTLDDLADQAEHAMNIVCGGMDEVNLMGTVDALEALANIVEVLQKMASAVNGRTAQIRERELTERPGGTALQMMDSALVSLGLGHDTAEVMHHLLAIGRRGLVRLVEDV